ncbi:DUF4328 domain-containing protein [Kitasatospora sp. NPDC093806]|uniref:DUF4328 domain-containing protein n=1 Tax=Kitasatospora sp. NPDC093806 TaxID=3155075 RepID=UPI00342CE04E
MVCVVCGARPVAGESARCFACAEAAPNWPRDYRSAQGLAVAVTVLLVLSGLLALALLVSDVFGLRAVDAVLADGADTEAFDALDALESLWSLTAGLSVLTLVATAVLFVLWFQRIRANADLFAPHGHKHSSGWAVGAWFTPVVNLWFPWRLVVDCWQASAPVDAEGQRRIVSQALVSTWWVSWVGSLVLGRVASVVSRSVASEAMGRSAAFEEVRSALQWEIAASALRAVAAVLVVLVVWRLTGMQQARAAMVVRLAFRPGQVAVPGVPTVGS